VVFNILYNILKNALAESTTGCSFSSVPTMMNLKKYLSLLVVFTAVLMNGPCVAKFESIVQHEDVAVVHVPQWQTDTNIPFKLSDGATCYIPANEKDVYDLIVKISNAGIVSNIQCHENPEIFDINPDLE
jgi:hypothetical protein